MEDSCELEEMKQVVKDVEEVNCHSLIDQL